VNLTAGVDLGGTKIVSALFDENWQPVLSQRVATPADSYDSLLAALTAQIRWIQDHATVPVVGLGVPGIVDRDTLALHAANLRASGQRLGVDLAMASSVDIRLINDSKALALSEACLGAGAPYRSVLGISIGTGIAAGMVVRESLLSDPAGMAGEIGHMSIPAATIQNQKLPVLSCACGKSGCYETFLCGPGFTRLGECLYGVEQSVESWSQQYRDNDRQATTLMAHWYTLLAAMLAEMMLCYDPDCIVFGGGVTAMPDFILNTENALQKAERLTRHMPALHTAGGHEFSAARGAALAAVRYRPPREPK
jgi:predicted NBD/HSP70 family sugar kinase